ncbi:hypothetical protein D3C72_583920 [compost metagenome]|jgi:hypothetical protein
MFNTMDGRLRYADDSGFTFHTLEAMSALVASTTVFPAFWRTPMNSSPDVSTTLP